MNDDLTRLRAAVLTHTPASSGAWSPGAADMMLDAFARERPPVRRPWRAWIQHLLLVCRF